MTGFDDLKKLQELDSEIDRLRKEKVNLPEKEKLDSLCKELERLNNYVLKKEEEFRKEEREQKKLDGEVETMVNKITSEEKKLYSGKISNPKELSSIQKEIKNLNDKKDEKETDLIGQLDVVDNLRGVLTKLDNQKKEFLIAKDKLEKFLNNTSLSIDNKIDELCRQKKEIVPLIERDLLTLYEEIIVEKGGIAVVDLENGVCQGCGMEPSAEEMDRMSNSDSLWRCDHCRRILLK
jgi:predicted  nucleic acid-binding Zn-ribbon protein